MQVVAGTCSGPHTFGVFRRRLFAAGIGVGGRSWQLGLATKRDRPRHQLVAATGRVHFESVGLAVDMWWSAAEWLPGLLQRLWMAVELVVLAL